MLWWIGYELLGVQKQKTETAAQAAKFVTDEEISMLLEEKV